MNYGKKGASDKQKALTSTGIKTIKKVTVNIFKAFLLCLIIFAVVATCAGIGVVRGIIKSAPDISNVTVTPTKYSTIVYDQDGTEITKLVASGSNRVGVTIDEIPKNMQNAFVAVEDERFWQHKGIDIKGIFRAGVKGITTGGHFSEGASTITQQLLKNNVFSNWTEESNLTERVERKIQEQYLAVQLEKTMDKKVILENYLNTINLGQNTLGVQAASHRYFNKDVWDLSLSECAVIAAITKNPSKYNPVSYPDNNKERQNKVLTNMLTQGYITKDEYNAALKDDVYSRIQTVNAEKSSSSIYTYFIDELTEQVMEDLQEQKGYTQTQAYNALYSGGLSIYTTQDTNIQNICNEEFSNPDNYPSKTQIALTYRLTIKHKDGTTENLSEENLKKYFQETDGISYHLIFNSEDEAKEQVERYKAAILKEGDQITESITLTPQPQASIVVMDQSTGYVKAIVGGRGNKNASLTLNRATNTTRQPGSTFKVLSSFAPALDTGNVTLSTVFDDAPYNYASGRPVSNWYKGYRGLSNVRLAITNSMNIVAVKTLTKVTPQVGFDYLEKFGFTTLVKSRKQADGTTVSDITQALALGGITDGVTNLELTAAYATVADHGVYHEPVFYTKILDHDGNVLIDNTPSTTTVIKETTAFLLTSAMEDVVTNGTGKAVSFGGMPIAGKTGTTTDYRDVWFSGFTPYYTCSVWGGYDTNDKMSSSTSFHKTLWRKVMQRIHENLEKKEFVVPDSIEKAAVCKKSGKLAVAGLCDSDPRGNMAYTEYFTKGTAPTEVCDTHVRVGDQVFIVRPEDSTGDTEDSPFELPAEYLDFYKNGIPIPVPANGTEDSSIADPSAAPSATEGDTTTTGSSIQDILNNIDPLTDSPDTTNPPTTENTNQ